MCGPWPNHYANWAILVVNITIFITDIITAVVINYLLAVPTAVLVTAVTVTVSVMTVVEQNFLILYISWAVVLQTQIYLQGTEKYIVFDATACFGHKLLPSSGSYST